MLQFGNDFYNWSNVSANQTLEEKYLPIPKVEWNCGDINFNVEAFANGGK